MNTGVIKRRSLFWLLAAAVAALFLFGSTPASAASDPFSLSDTSGYCGEHVMWKFDEKTGKLTIAGEGAMYDYAPWDKYKNKIKKVEIQSGVTSVGSYDFAGYSNLKTVVIASSVKVIGESAFQYCTKLTKVTIPKSVYKIGRNAFYGCSKLKTVQINSGVKIIGQAAFADCAKLKTVTIPETVTTIGKDAFRGDKALRKAFIGTGVKRIGGSAFKGCTSLKRIVFKGSAPSFGNNKVFSGVTAKAKYHKGKKYSWTAKKRADYGGTITWKSY